MLHGSIVKRISAVALAALTFLNLPCQARSLTGMQLSDAEKQDFFVWFHFKEHERRKMSGDRTLIEYDTSADGNSVVLGVSVDKDQRVQYMELMLPRKFVNDPKDGALARDIAKSFLHDAVSESDTDSVKTLVSEVQYGGQTLHATSVNVGDGKDSAPATLLTPSSKPRVGDEAWIGSGGDIPKLPAENSPAYATFLGNNDSFEKRLSHCTLRLTNQENAGKLLLIVTSN